jgi:trimeric autotransporter adhesin
MKTPLHSVFVALALSAGSIPALAQGTAIHYQGQLTDTGSLANGSYDFRFELFDAGSGGSPVGVPLTNTAVSVSNGLFAVELDFGPGVFPGADRWLELGVRKVAPNAFTTLTPRQKLTAVPYAITASQVTGLLPSGGLAGTYGSMVNFNNPGNSFAGNGAGLTNVSAVTIGGLTAGQFWQRTGNSGTTPGTHFLGTTDNQPLELKVYSGRVLRLEPAASGAPNVIGGAAYNSVDGGVIGATIAGGGATSYFSSAYTNRVGGHFSTVGGGSGNLIDSIAQYSTIGGGWFNTIQSGVLHGAIAGGVQNTIETSARSATIGGGEVNRIQYNASRATIAGGWNHVIGSNAPSASIGGGYHNTLGEGAAASVIAGGQDNSVQKDATGAAIGGGLANLVASNADYATLSGGFQNAILTNAFSAMIGGGWRNTNSGRYAMISGGRENNASGDFSLAAGYGAKATNQGSFVWADALGGSFASTADNQFSVRASGGVRLETGGAGLTVDGQPVGGVLSGDGSLVVNLNATELAFGTVDDARLSANVALLSSGAAFNGDLASTGDVLGRRLNIGLSNLLTGSQATIAGGQANTNRAAWASIGGGLRNAVQSSANFATIGGGGDNVIESSALDATIAGGANNVIGYNAQDSSIGGGFMNVIEQWSQRVVVGGGYHNLVQSNAQCATVGGGNDNSIAHDAAAATIAGGSAGNIGSFADHATLSGGSGSTIGAFADHATISGGELNTNGAAWATISGGLRNTIQSSANGASIGGGGDNVIESSALLATIAGGSGNAIRFNAQNSSLGGGFMNVVEQWAQRVVLGGGSDNLIRSNASYSTLSGGSDNIILNGASFATVPGGRGNSATNYAFAAGRQAKANHSGSFVWADSQFADFPSTTADEVSFRCAGGVRFTSGSGAANQTVSWAPGNASWSFSSDRQLKEEVETVDVRAVLDKVSRLPVAEWNYTGHPQRHIGPMAQDFHQLFALNDNDKMLDSGDLHGVALAAIQGLNQKLEAQAAAAKAKEARITELEQRLAALEQLLKLPAGK